MTGEETADAARALIDWLNSQRISPEGSIPVILTAAAAIIREVADRRGLDRMEGGKAASDGLIKALRVIP